MQKANKKSYSKLSKLGTVLITGCAGFCGYWLVKYIREKFPHTYITGADVIDNKKVNNILDEFYFLDLANFEKTQKVINKIKPEIVFHFAGIFGDKNLETIYKINVGGTANLLKAVQSIKTAHKTRVILAGSAAVYGNTPIKRKHIDEYCKVQPVTHYGISKASEEMVGRLYAKESNIKIIFYRMFNLIGPGLSVQLLPGRIAGELTEIKKGKKKNVIKVGNINSIRDFLDIRDAVKLYVNLALYGKAGEIYNVGSGKGIRISDLLKCFISQSKLKVSLISEPSLYKNNDVEYSVADITKLSRIIPVIQEIKIEQSVSDMLKYYKSTKK